MRPIFFAWFVLHGTTSLFAQDPSPAPDALAAGKQRVTAALQKTATTDDVAFRATWGANRKKKTDDDDLAAMFGVPRSGTITGSWHAGLQHLVFEGGNEDELWRTNLATVARDKEREWCARKNRFADGNPISFSADVAALLRELAAMDLAVVQRTPGSIDDRPVEIVTVTLNADQVTELLRGEHVPESLLQGAMTAFQFARLGAGQRPEAQKPTSTVDLAIAFDPGTSLVQELRFRSWTKNEGNGRNIVLRGGGAGGVRVLNGNAGDEDEEADDEKDQEKTKDAASAPLQFEDGLPVRPRKKTTVMDFTVRLSEHGAKKAPELDAAAKKLLGR